ncbi:MAG: hypothetical protein R3E12_01800 [Candidatus Eisenbacteria bacterium]
MTTDELTNVLSFLEAAVMSDRIYYDGTVPRNDLDRVQHQLARLKREFETTKWKIEPMLAPSESRLYDLCRRSAEQASEMIRTLDLDEVIAGRTDRPVSGNIDDFVSYITKDYGSDRLRTDAAMEIVEKVMADKKTFRGSKCVAGILASELDGFDLLGRVRSVMENATEDERRQLIGALINRFRINYLNEESSLDDYEAAFLADPGIESLCSQQVTLLINYLFRKIAEQNRDFPNSEIRSFFTGQHRKLPIGLSILLKAKPGKGPRGLVEAATQLHHRIFTTMAASKTPQQRLIHQFEEDQFRQLEEDLLGDHFADLLEGRKKTNPLLRFVNTRIPAILGATAAAALGNVIQDLQTLAIAVGGSAALQEALTAAGLRLNTPTDRYNVYVDHFQNLKRFFDDAVLLDVTRTKTISGQVEAVFGRSLQLSAK